MLSKKAKSKTTKKCPQHAISNVFAMSHQSQIQKFKEAFNTTDQNRGSFINKYLHNMLASEGKNPIDAYLDLMMNEAPGPLNFTMFSEKLNSMDPEDMIRNTFACFEEEATATIQEDYLHELLTTMCNYFTNE
ncbi:Myosin regulatory light polypeptide 9 [Heterocephalus glaber]|uniref:Myosin regulatory light polypeptide 9 n=1 Tax=Heterocephalus glaber TaxID=10181 RepID=G5BIJ1_HETGA|nr:Myosin regulatory light polypeptide 9 [Heterocephalus glaber]